MKSKKIISCLLVLGVLGSVFLGYKVCVNGNDGENIKQEVVYTAKENIEDISADYKLTDEETEEYKALSKQVLKRYFDISDEDYEGLTFRATIVSEKSLTAMQTNLKQQLQEAYDNKKLTKEEYDEQIEMCNGGPKDSYENAKKNLKHTVISAVWVNQDKAYAMNFNASTNEIDDANISENEEGKTALNLSEEELKKTAENFINDKGLSDIENLNFESTHDSKEKGGNECLNLYWVTYNHKDNNNEKVMIGISVYSGKVEAFVLS